MMMFCSVNQCIGLNGLFPDGVNFACVQDEFDMKMMIMVGSWALCSMYAILERKFLNLTLNI